MQNAGRQVSLNVRYLLWKQDRSRDTWAGQLSKMSGLDQALSRAIVQGEALDRTLTSEQLEQLCRAFGFHESEQELRYRDLVEEEADVLLENLRYLFEGLERGGKRDLADELRVDATTVSRWLNGTSKPRKTTLDAIARYFGLPREVDLRREPLFLSVDPMAIADQKRWSIRQIEEMNSNTFRELYPALRRMLEDR